MADTTDANPAAPGTSDLISQVANELTKADREGVKSKLKELLKKRREAEKTMRLLDIEMQKIIADFEAGV